MPAQQPEVTIRVDLAALCARHSDDMEAYVAGYLHTPAEAGCAPMTKEQIEHMTRVISNAFAAGPLSAYIKNQFARPVAKTPLSMFGQN